jgi:hypothetical protein
MIEFIEMVVKNNPKAATKVRKKIMIRSDENLEFCIPILVLFKFITELKSSLSRASPASFDIFLYLIPSLN